MRRLITAASVLAIFAAIAGPAAAKARSVCPRVPRHGHVTCYALVQVHKRARNRHGGADVIASVVNPGGYHPADLQAAYGLASAAAKDGVGQTVAIVDVYNDPNAAANLATYRSTFALPPCGSGCFTEVNQTGGSNLPAADSGWSDEISLDLDMVSAVCPNCKILLVEASSTSFANLLTAENYATAHATEVSNSWGSPEFSGESSYDSYFEKPIPITFASGDSGYGVQYPAASPYVTAVGGTTLNRSSDGRGFTETAWSGSGSGCSAYEPKPAWQKQSICAKRAIADVSADANPSTGVAVYDTYGAAGWLQFGGTSVAAPIVAGVYALAGGFKTALYGSLPYAHTGSVFDVVGGTTGKCSVTALCTAVSGYDGPTGLGTPDGIAAF